MKYSNIDDEHPRDAIELFLVLRLLGDSPLDEICCVLHSGNRLGTILTNANVEFLFQGHHYLHLHILVCYKKPMDYIKPNIFSTKACYRLVSKA